VLRSSCSITHLSSQCCLQAHRTNLSYDSGRYGDEHADVNVNQPESDLLNFSEMLCGANGLPLVCMNKADINKKCKLS